MTDKRILFLAAAFLVGCGEQPPAEPAPKPDDEVPAAIPAEPTPEPEVTLTRPKLPDDVFFDDPLAIAANRTLIPGARQSVDGPVVDMPSGEKPTEPMTPAEEPAKAVDWATLLPAELLVAEVNRIRERFDPKLASVATFNSSLLDFPPYAAELAALAGIATEHSGNIPWKDDAKYVRDLATEMLSDQLQRGQKSYEQVKLPFDKVSALLDGKRPDDLPEADDATDFALTSDFGYLMRRFEAGQNYLRTTGGSEPAFKQNAQDLIRETRVLAALSEVIASEDFGYGDDEKFQGYATLMTQAALDAAAAAQAGDFAKFDLSNSALGQSCNKCHGDYRNN